MSPRTPSISRTGSTTAPGSNRGRASSRRPRELNGPIRALALLLAGLPVLASEAQQSPPPPPWEGGFTHSLGQPSRVYPFLVPLAGIQGAGEDRVGGGRLLAGLYHPVTNPLVGLLGLNAEAYVGLRNIHVEGGGRLLLASHFFRVAGGIDLNLRQGGIDGVFSAAVPLRRGGILGTGSLLRLDWIPGRSQLELGVSVPLHRNAGKTRPREDHVSLKAPAPAWLPIADPEPALAPIRAEIRESIRRIDLLITPLIDPGSGDPELAAHALAAGVRGALPAGTAAGPATVALVRSYHALLEQAFALAAGDSVAGARAAALARELLLDHVLFPYNRLLGQRRSHDRLSRFQTVAWTGFVRDVRRTGARPDRWPHLIAVFQDLLDAVELARAGARKRWGDGRLVWLPLQYGLRPDEHNTQADLDSLVARAVGRPFTGGNRIAYVPADLFQEELRRSIRRARAYHVLWIHDFAGRNEAGEPDSVALATVIGYLDALTAAVRNYEDTGRIPSFFVFLDQFYFQQSGSRLWLSLLERPLEQRLRLPPGFRSGEARVREAQQRLRDAVARSSLLQLEARQYGTAWIANLLKVHVNITNPPDRSFNSEQVIPFYGLPDDVIRDHRKVVFYDIDPDRPDQGEAVYTGAGVGDQYVGADWEDRAIVVRGPANRSLREAARDLLETQGLSGRRMPWPFRADPPSGRAATDDSAPAGGGGGGADARLLELHNETGYAPKDLSVARATLYTLMPPGSVVMVSDARWGDHLAGSMLFGASLRGARVILLAPSAATTSNTGWPAMSRLWEFLARVLRAGRELAAELEAAGGQFRVGIYDPGIPANDVRARFRVFADAERRTSWLDSLLAFHPDAEAVVRGLDSLVVAAARPRPLERTAAPADTVAPKLHIKGELFVIGEGWDRLLARPEFASVLRTFAINQARALDPDADGAERARAMAADMARVLAPAVSGMLDDLPADARARVAYYLMVGSANQNNRSFLLDGEASVLVSGPVALQALVDFIVLLGLCTWLETPELLEAHVPRPGGVHRFVARWLRTII